jgi:hypothetical protein
MARPSHRPASPGHRPPARRQALPRPTKSTERHRTPRACGLFPTTGKGTGGNLPQGGPRLGWWTGLVGAALIVSALALLFRLAFHNATRCLESGHGCVQLGAALGCSGLLVHSFVDFNLHTPATAVWFAVLAGVASTGSTSTLGGVLTKSHTEQLQEPNVRQRYPR